MNSADWTIFLFDPTAASSKCTFALEGLTAENPEEEEALGSEEDDPAIGDFQDPKEVLRPG